MADNIVGGLFGIDPAQIQQQRMSQDLKEGYMLAQLSPMERATAGIYSGSKQLGRAAQGLLGMEDPELQEATMAKKLAANFDVNSVEGLRGLSAALKQAGSMKYSQLAAQQAMDLEKQGLGIRKEKAAVEKAEMSAAQEEQLRQELATLGPNPSEQQVLAVVQKYGSPDKILQVLTASQDRKAALAARQASAGAGVGPLTPAQKALDTAFGKDYAAFINKGGSSLIKTQLDNLDTAIAALENKSNITGKVVGLADKSGTLSYVNPDAQEVKDVVGKVVQSDLRQVLGGQFAQKEGEQLLARSYNPAQPQTDNLNRLKSLRKQIADAAEQKIGAVNYFEANGSLKGFKGLQTPETEAPKSKKTTTRKLKSGVEVTVEE